MGSARVSIGVEARACAAIDQLRKAATCCNVSVISLPLTTERLSVTMLRAEHAANLAEYRSDPQVARYQDWDVPYTIEMAERLVDGQSQLDGPANDDWVQLAVVVDGTSIGDVAVGIHDEGRQATIGYSIRVADQGKGYATEAVGAVIDALFDEAHLHRIVAGVDPDNVASKRVLEKIGFRYEGRSKDSVFVRGEWVDDDRFALLAGEHDRGATSAADRG
jgi:RimJ/RimL family protein N-acetyltransferase